MKKIFIGSMLVLTLLLLMPSIPAIQQKTIESESSAKLQDLDVEKIKDFLNIKPLDFSPTLLTYLISAIFFFRFMRGWLLCVYAVTYDGLYETITKPIIYDRGTWLYETAYIWLVGWQYFYEIVGWEWDLTP